MKLTCHAWNMSYLSYSTAPIGGKDAGRSEQLENSVALYMAVQCQGNWGWWLQSVVTGADRQGEIQSSEFKIGSSELLALLLLKKKKKSVFECFAHSHGLPDCIVSKRSHFSNAKLPAGKLIAPSSLHQLSDSVMWRPGHRNTACKEHVVLRNIQCLKVDIQMCFQTFKSALWFSLCV